MRHVKWNGRSLILIIIMNACSIYVNAIIYVGCRLWCAGAHILIYIEYLLQYIVYTFMTLIYRNTVAHSSTHTDTLHSRRQMHINNKYNNLQNPWFILLFSQRYIVERQRVLLWARQVSQYLNLEFCFRLFSGCVSLVISSVVGCYFPFRLLLLLDLIFIYIYSLIHYITIFIIFITSLVTICSLQFSNNDLILVSVFFSYFFFLLICVQNLHFVYNKLK